MSERELSTNSKAIDEVNKLLLEKLILLTDKIASMEEKMDYNIDNLAEKIDKVDFKMHQIDGKVKNLDKKIVNKMKSSGDVKKPEEKKDSQNEDDHPLAELIKSLTKVPKRQISTGSSKLDEIMGGGIEPGHITSISADPKRGKTEFCHTLAVTCQIEDVGQGPMRDGEKGKKGKCFYIDCNGSFSPERLRLIAKRFNLDPEKVISNVTHFPCQNTKEQMEFLTKAQEMMVKEKYSLIIVDDIMFHFRKKYPFPNLETIEQLDEYTTESGKFFKELSNLLEKFNVAVVVTSRDKEVIADNRMLMYYTVTGLWLLIEQDGNRVCNVYKSPNLPEREAFFEITDAGICDVTE